MQVDENISFDQFSHDLTLALEETSKGVAGSRWGLRRRTRSTGNLPFPPQPTEEDSSSTEPNDANELNNNDHFAGRAGLRNSILSDSDDRHSYAFAFKLRQTSYFSGNFESDSLNENFSPSKPNVRRKRKFKRIAVEYENSSVSHPTNFPTLISGAVKKRVLKHNQENLRGNMFFGKRKRPHRDRYTDHDGFKHSNSVPRQRGGFLSQKESASYLECKSRNRASSMSTARACSAVDRILPLNNSILSKIEKISKESQSKIKFKFIGVSQKAVAAADAEVAALSKIMHFQSEAPMPETSSDNLTSPLFGQVNNSPKMVGSDQSSFQQKYFHAESTESALPSNNKTISSKFEHKKKVKRFPSANNANFIAMQSKRRQNRRLKLQFDDQNFMDCCENLNEFLSSSSLSSSDSEAEVTNESDHEGDDELTDFPGHEVMVNFASKNEFKRANRKVNKSPQVKNQDVDIQDDDTLMSADEINDLIPEESLMIAANSLTTDQLSTTVIASHVPAAKFFHSHPIDITRAVENCFILDTKSTASRTVEDCGYGSNIVHSHNFKQHIESEMSGETSNHFLSSPNAGSSEVREIRAGCRRIREERPGFSIVTSFNEDLLKFVQDDQQRELRIFDIQEYEKILELAKLYSLNIQPENNHKSIILTKTSNTMQAVKISKENKQYFFNDYKRRCVGGKEDTE